MPQPFEMVSGPLVIFTAPEGTLAPEISADPPAPWGFLGTNGARSISDDGLSANFEETVESQRSLGSTAIQKLFRTEEDMTFSCSLLDVTAETFSVAMSGLAITEVPAGVGTGGYRSVGLLRGFNVLNLAFLMRGFSPYADNQFAQFWVPKAYASFSGELTYVKGEAAAISIEIMAIEHLIHGYGQYRAQFAAPL
jgi:hypothetical protein